MSPLAFVTHRSSGERVTMWSDWYVNYSDVILRVCFELIVALLDVKLL